MHTVLVAQNLHLRLVQLLQGTLTVGLFVLIDKVSFYKKKCLTISNVISTERLGIIYAPKNSEGSQEMKTTQSRQPENPGEAFQRLSWLMSLRVQGKDLRRWLS